jgi:hypothetical protein
MPPPLHPLPPRGGEVCAAGVILSCPFLPGASRKRDNLQILRPWREEVGRRGFESITGGPKGHVKFVDQSTGYFSGFAENIGSDE